MKSLFSKYLNMQSVSKLIKYMQIKLCILVSKGVGSNMIAPLDLVHAKYLLASVKWAKPVEIIRKIHLS